jgi:hypothetical protein
MLFSRRIAATQVAMLGPVVHDGLVGNVHMLGFACLFVVTHRLEGEA